MRTTPAQPPFPELFLSGPLPSPCVLSFPLGLPHTNSPPFPFLTSDGASTASTSIFPLSFPSPFSPLAPGHQPPPPPLYPRPRSTLPSTPIQLLCPLILLPRPFCMTYVPPQSPHSYSPTFSSIPLSRITLSQRKITLRSAPEIQIALS